MVLSGFVCHCVSIVTTMQRRELLIRRVEKIAIALERGQVCNKEHARTVLNKLWGRVFAAERELNLSFGD